MASYKNVPITEVIVRQGEPSLIDGKPQARATGWTGVTQRHNGPSCTPSWTTVTRYAETQAEALDKLEDTIGPCRHLIVDAFSGRTGGLSRD